MLQTTQKVSPSLKHGSTVSSVDRVPDSYSQGRGFESHQGRGVVSLSKILHLQVSSFISYLRFTM